MGRHPSLQEITTLLDRKEMSATELLQSTLDRAKRLNPDLRAISYLSEEEAFAQASAADRRISRGERLAPLDGIPLHVKDNIFLRGIPCSWGSALYKDFRPDADDHAVARLREQGAILFAKTNTPELALSGTTSNLVFGTTCNPYAPDRIPGGSSGGAVAATAAGIGLGGLATDAGGSIRRPAGYSGVVGLRTSLGAVPRRHGFLATVNDFQTIGPVARTIDDLEIIFTAIRRHPSTVIACPGAANIRIALILNGPGFVVEPAVADVVRRAADALAALGYPVEEIEAPWDRESMERIFAVLSAAGAARIAAMHDERDWRSLASEAIRRLAETGHGLTAVEYVQALDMVADLRARALDWFSECTLWLMPTSPCTAWKIGEDYPATIAGKKAGPRGAAIYGPIVNALGAAGLALPVGTDPIGLPIGAQLVAGPGEDHLALSIGKELMAVLGYPPAPPL